MIAKYLSVMWTAIAPALGNHLWQSTLFAVVAGLLTLILQKNQARARYWIWLAASVKFLIPFSLLAGIGSHLAWSRDSAGAKGGLYFAMEEASQPFTQPTMAVISRATPTTVFAGLIHLLPAIVAGVWLCGFVVVVSIWYARWRRVSAVVREAAPLREGREVEALRRLERVGGIPNQIKMLVSRASLEPGVFGIARPVLVWPEGISGRLEDVHLEAILAHELCHVRRRDNLAAAMHMMVEAIFWFYPLVWWMGARLVEEREHACDEEVLELGGDRQVYAESILKICEFCVGSPLTCVAGVTGADLKKRIVRIMTKSVVRNLDFSRKLLLGVVGLVVLASPVVFGLVSAPQRQAESQTQEATAFGPEFKYNVVSIKPNKSGRAGYSPITPDGLTLIDFQTIVLVNMAYGNLRKDQFLGAPDWFDSDGYDVVAKMDSSVADELQKLSLDQRELARLHMMRELLADRFKLKFHREIRELPIYKLVIAEGGPKLKEAVPGEFYPHIEDGKTIQSGANTVGVQPGTAKFYGATIARLTQFLGRQLGREVVDKTGLTGNYDFKLRWAPTEAEIKFVGIRPSDSTVFPPFSPKTIEDQIGLKLESGTGPVEVRVIDHIEKPSEN